MEDSLALIVGAGISVDSPSCLPSWWDYNKTIVKVIKEQAELLCPNAKEVLEELEVNSNLPVQCLSDVLVNEGAGKYYFPLLKLLNSTIPNANHYSIEMLAEEGIVSTIITTNFDTLIETAFENRKTRLSVKVTDDEYGHQINECNQLFKIHGTVQNVQTLIDTVTQKAMGLSDIKRKRLNSLLREKDIAILGFSGADLDFDLNYIPIFDSLQNGHKLTWVVYPGTELNDNILKLKDKFPLQVTTRLITLKEYFSEFGIDYEEIEKSLGSCKCDSSPNLIEDTIRVLFSGDGIGKHGCMGYCISLLSRIGKEEEANKLANIYEQSLDLEKINLDSILGISALAHQKLRNQETMAAIKYFESILLINSTYKEMFTNLNISSSISTKQMEEAYRERQQIDASVRLNIANAYFFMREFKLAKEYANTAELYMKEDSYERYLLDFLYTRIDYFETRNIKKYVTELKNCAKKIRKIGRLESAIEIMLSEVRENIKNDEYSIAIETLSVVSEYSKNICNAKLLIDIQCLYSECYYNKNEIEIAKDFLDKAISMAIDVGNKKWCEMLLHRITVFPMNEKVHNQMIEMGKVCDVEINFLYRAPNGTFFEDEQGQIIQLK